MIALQHWVSLRLNLVNSQNASYHREWTRWVAIRIEQTIEAKRVTFTEYMDKLQEINNMHGSESDNETASESETSVESSSLVNLQPVLYTLRNKKKISQSSQILFLSQVDSVLDSPSPSPPIQVQAVEKKRAVAPTTGNEVKSSQQQSLSTVILSQESDEVSAVSEAPKRPRFKSPHNYTPDDSEEGRAYTEAIQRLQTIPYTAESISKHFKTRELFMILSKHYDALPSSASKKRCINLLLTLLQQQIIQVKRVESNSSPISLPVAASFLSCCSGKGWFSFLFLLPSTCCFVLSFPSSIAYVLQFVMFVIDRKHSHSETSWVHSSFSYESEFPFLSSLLHPTDIKNDFPSSRPSSNSLFINYWSKYNSRLFDFQPSDSIAVHIPVLVELYWNPEFFGSWNNASHALPIVWHTWNSSCKWNDLPTIRSSRRVGGSRCRKSELMLADNM